MKETPVLVRLGQGLLVSLLAGVLLAGVALPLFGGLGLVVKAGADSYIALPTDLQTPRPATRSRVLAADGSTLASFYRVNRTPAPFDKIPLTMRHAIVAIEDSRFYEHEGVDYKGTLRAAITNAKSGRVSQGGSTLTQQYVKNALIEGAYGDKQAQAAAKADNLERKLQEARYALALEQRLTKDEILNRYLDIAYYGNGVYGIGTAANFYFGKSVDQLDLPESALLAGVVQNPTRYDIARKDVTVRREVVGRRNTVLARMRDLGYITEVQRAATAAQPLPDITPQKVLSGCEAPGVAAPFFCAYVLDELSNTPVGASLGETREERQARLFAGGLTIKTTLNPRIQAGAQQAVNDQVPPVDPSGAVAVSDIVEPGTGHIQAMAVDRGYGIGRGQTKVNYATGGSAGYQPGSTFKAFFLAAALQQGVPLSTTHYSPQTYNSTIFPDCTKPGPVKGCQGYQVSNAGDSESGTFDLRTATEYSVNTYYIQLAEQIGLQAPVDLAGQLGLQWFGPKDPAKGLAQGQLRPLNADNASVFLGAQEVSPLAMAGAYAAFAAHGQFCPPRAIVGITGPGGEQITVPDGGCKQVLEPKVADTVVDVLTGVIQRGTGTGAAIGRPAAGKTGTTDSSRAAWFVGFTPQLATASWVGEPDKNPPYGFVPMRYVRINGRYYRQMYGGNLPATIWRQTMQAAVQGMPVQSFAGPDQQVVNGQAGVGQGTIPQVSGLSYDQAAQRVRDAGFAPSYGKRVSSRLRQGTVVYSYPKEGSAAAPGTTVFLYRSQ